MKSFSTPQAGDTLERISIWNSPGEMCKREKKLVSYRVARIHGWRILSVERGVFQFRAEMFVRGTDKITGKQERPVDVGD